MTEPRSRRSNLLARRVRIMGTPLAICSDSRYCGSLYITQPNYSLFHLLCSRISRNQMLLGCSGYRKGRRVNSREVAKDAEDGLVLASSAFGQLFLGKKLEKVLRRNIACHRWMRADDTAMVVLVNDRTRAIWLHDLTLLTSVGPLSRRSF
jgi:hypothetical protein